MNIIVLSPLRLLGEALSVSFDSRPGFRAVAVVSDLTALRNVLSDSEAQAVLIDVGLGIDLFDVRPIAIEWPEVRLIAVGLNDQRQEVIACGRAGYSGYVPRDCSIDTLCNELSEIVEGRFTCSPEVSSTLLRALFRQEPNSEKSNSDPPLTRRESEVLELLGRGFSNKEIAQELCLSVATVKHHVHHVLEKMQVERRAQAMRRVRDAPWLGRSVSSCRK